MKKAKIKFEYSAGGAVYKRAKSKEQRAKIEWLIVNPKGTDRWQLPKGFIDQGESAQQTALREVEEEGGVKTRVIDKIDKIEFFYQMDGVRRKKTVTFFLLEYLSGSTANNDSEIETAKFVFFKEALQLLNFDTEKEVLKKAKTILEEREKTAKTSLEQFF